MAAKPVAGTGDKVCPQKRSDGSPCTLKVLEGQEACWVHRATPEQRKEWHARGGAAGAYRNKAGKNLPDHLVAAREKLIKIIDQVESGLMKPQIAITITQIIARLVELERFGLEVSQAEILERKLDALEQKLKRVG